MIHACRPIFIRYTVRSYDFRKNSQPCNRLSTTIKPSNYDKLAAQHHTPIVEKLWQERGLKVLSHDNTSKSKVPSFSRTEVIYKFSEDPLLSDSYANPWGYVRVGRILEDLDALAGNIAANHCLGLTTHDDLFPLLVTASVDKIQIFNQGGNLKLDMKITGNVVWVGRSSLEIQLKVVSVYKKKGSEAGVVVTEDKEWASANFTFVARHPQTGEAVEVPRLVPETEEEKKIFEQIETKYRKNKQQKNEKVGSTLSLLSWPDEASLHMGHQLLKESRALLDMPSLANRDSILISQTKLSNALICQHQQRNTHGRIFGGFLMRRAYELAFATAYVFCGTSPRFREIDHVIFQKPVNIGDLLRLESCVVHTSRSKSTACPLVYVEVVASIVKPEVISSFVSNTFHFTFEKADGGYVRRVLPETLEEARKVVMMVRENVDDY